MMNSMLLLAHSPILLFVSGMTFFFNLPLSLSLDWISTCTSRFSCGNITDVDYPFWGGSRLEGCGHPQLKLNCEHERNLTTIEIANVKYHVLEIKKTPPILKISRADFRHGICSPEFGSTALDSKLLEYAPGFGDIFLFYNSTKTSTLFVGYFTCPSGSGYRNGYVSLEPQTEAGIYDSSVTVGIHYLSYYGAIGNTSMVEKALREGFEVRYKLNCTTCNKFNEVCGYESNSTEVRCYVVTTKDKPESSSKLKLTAGSSSKLKWTIAALSGLVLLMILIVTTYKRGHLLSTVLAFWKKGENNRFNVEAFLKSHGSFCPKRYSYSNIKKMTNSFADLIGKGGFGSVYKGKLADGRLVAVKVIINESKDYAEEFINEVSSIGRTSHINIITLVGFCYEGTKRALIYDYMPNGSLEKFIFNHGSTTTNPCLEWKILYEITIGVARGLEYLHRGCKTRILHFDIKPQNILLDKNFCPKISDFGLAKLWLKKESVMSLMETRGTAGYIAPEVFNRNYGGVSHKSDVYSYGMLVLELVGGRKVFDYESSESYPHEIYKHLELGDDHLSTVMEITAEEEKEMLRKMILVGFWCIQTNPSDRPSMSKAVEMLEGSLESLEIPPKPFLFSPTRSPQQSTRSS